MADPAGENRNVEDRAEEQPPRRARAAKAGAAKRAVAVKAAAAKKVAAKKVAAKKVAGTARKTTAVKRSAAPAASDPQQDAPQEQQARGGRPKRKQAPDQDTARGSQPERDQRQDPEQHPDRAPQQAPQPQPAEAEPLLGLPSPAVLARARDRALPPGRRTSPLLVPDAKVALSTASVYPENTAAAFEMAGRLGYDGVEVMVWTDPVSQDIDALRRLSDYHGVPILAVHAPCLLITQRVWGTDPWQKLVRARAAAEKLGASAVVVHPPFRWQRQYARDFVQGIWQMAGETDVRFAVENMYPWRYRDREVAAYAPDWDPTTEDYRHFTVDLSHVSTARTDALAMLDRMGDRLAHVHLADGSGSAKDEHLIPGRGTQPCAELLERLARSGFGGHVVLEVNTRRAAGPVEREADLAEALAFTRLHLAASAQVGSGRH
ncbi:sugar phosphate isomerase/epimerase [Streptacidiphilus sp. EB129]